MTLCKRHAAPGISRRSTGQAAAYGRIVKDALASGETSGPLSILHYGDSHTAADEWTNSVRLLLQAQFGNGGGGYSLAGRPFASYRNVAAHMRVRANLTGKEYAKLMEFLRRWHDVPPPNPPVEPSPKRFFFSQPISELQKRQSPAETAPTPSEVPAQSGKVKGEPLDGEPKP